MTDHLAPFGQAIVAVRWGVVAVSLALAAPEVADGDERSSALLVGLGALTVLRTVRPLRDEGDARGTLSLALETAFAVGAVLATGPTDSPLLFALLTPAVVAGFARGFRFALQVAAAEIVAVGVPWFAWEPQGEAATALQWAGEVVLVGLVAAYARRILVEVNERRAAALDRLGRLSDANVLLFQLHQVTQSLPASLDLTEVLDATVDQLRQLFDAPSAAILLHEDTDGSWSVARRVGSMHPAGLLGDVLPPVLARAVAVRSTTAVDDLRSGGPGLDATAGSGLYGVLTARGGTIGLLALEHPSPHHFTERDVELLTGFADPVALAIDNARWFGRLRSVGADEERARLARDLHDRTGQSLAYVAFELDRIAKRSGRGDDVTEALEGLRGDVRKVVGELRDTLYDLRTDVTEADGLASTLAEFLQRVSERSGVETSLQADEAARLPLRRERELWRLTRELVTELERAAATGRIEVSWRCDGRSAELDLVRLDGSGAPAGGMARSPAMAALRQRAAGMGVAVAVTDEPGGGARVRCTLTG